MAEKEILPDNTNTTTFSRDEIDFEKEMNFDWEISDEYISAALFDPMAVYAEASMSRFGLDCESYQSYDINVDSEDENGIWAFDVMLTPPLSPSRTLSPDDDDSNSYPLVDKLLEVTENLDLDNCVEILNEPKLKSSLIQDCMWNSGICESDRNGSVANNAIVNIIDTPTATPPRPEEFIATTECVDPAAVFPYNLNDQNQQQFPDNQSDSEEEIDVVTVEKPNKRKLSAIEVSEQPGIGDHLHTSAKRFKTPLPNKSKDVGNVRGRVCIKVDMDSEAKRATHNVLERKRRNDLRSSFQTLRDQIPDLEENERAPKVNILKKAAEYIKQLKDEEKRLIALKAAEEAKRQALLDKISMLKRTH